MDLVVFAIVLVVSAGYAARHRWLRSRPKTLLIVRHGEGTHNVDQDHENEKHRDAALTETGYYQCAALRLHLQDLGLQADHVYVSPLRRAVNTARVAFPGVPVTVLPHARERHFKGHVCNCLPGEEVPSQDEPLDAVDARVSAVLQHVRQSSAVTVALVTHGNFISGLSRVLGRDRVPDYIKPAQYVAATLE